MKALLLKILQRIFAICARYYLDRSKPLVIGITGSVGKTSCRMIVSQILSTHLHKKVVYTSSKNFNSELGLIFSIFQIEDYTPGVWSLCKMLGAILWKAANMPKTYDILILEYGVDHPKDMDFLLSIVKPDYAIFTKLDKIHGCYFDTPNGIGDEKIKLIKAAKIKAYLNPKDDFCVDVFESLQGDKSYFSDIQEYALVNEEGGVRAKFRADNIAYSINIPGEENAIYTALGFDLLEDMGQKVIRSEIILDLDLQPGRFSFFKGVNKSILIDSSYNAGPESMKKMIENTLELKKQVFPEYKVILALGEMRELGDVSETEHRKLTPLAERAEEIFLVGSDMNYLKDECKDLGRSVIHSLKSRELGKDLRKFIEDSDQKYLVLFKGSQNTIFMEEALKEVLDSKADIKKLVRQSKDWRKKKDIFFTN